MTIALFTGGAFAAIVVGLLGWLGLFDLPLRAGQPDYMQALKPLLAIVGSMLIDWLNPRSKICRIGAALAGAAGFMWSVVLYRQVENGLVVVGPNNWYADVGWMAMLGTYFCLGVAMWPISVFLATRPWREWGAARLAGVTGQSEGNPHR